MKSIQSAWLRGIIWLFLMGLLTIVAVVIYSFLPHPESTASLKWLQFMQSICTFLIPSLLVACMSDASPFAWLHLDKGMSWRTALFAVLTMLCAIPAINLLSDLNQRVALPSNLHWLEELMRSQEDSAAQMIEQFMKTDSVWGLLINIGLMAFLPALCEEVSFRGVLQSLLLPNQSRTNSSMTPSLPHLSSRHHLSIWLTAAIFSFIHFQFYGFVPRMLMGAMFGYMVAWTGSLWVSMLMHFTNNAVAVLSYFYVYRNHLDPNSIDSIGISSTLWLGILSLVLVPTAIFLFRRYIRVFVPVSSNKNA